MGIFTVRSNEQYLWGGYGKYFIELQLEATRNTTKKQYTVTVKKAHVYGLEYNFRSICTINLAGNTNSFTIPASGSNTYSGYLPNSTGISSSNNNWLTLTSPSLTVNAKSDGTCPDINLTFSAKNPSVHWIVANKQISVYVDFNKNIANLVQSNSGGAIDVDSPSILASLNSIYSDKVSLNVVSNTTCNLLQYSFDNKNFTNVSNIPDFTQYTFDIPLINDIKEIYIKIRKKSNNKESISKAITIDNRVPYNTTLNITRLGRNKIQINASSDLADSYILNLNNKIITFDSINQINNIYSVENGNIPISITPVRRFVNGIKVNETDGLQGTTKSEIVDMIIPEVEEIKTGKFSDTSNNNINLNFKLKYKQNIICYYNDTYQQFDEINCEISSFSIIPQSNREYSIRLVRNGAADKFGSLEVLDNTVTFLYNSYPYKFDNIKIIKMGTNLQINGRITKYSDDPEKSSFENELINYELIDSRNNQNKFSGTTSCTNEGQFNIIIEGINVDNPYDLTLYNKRKLNGAYSQNIINNIVSPSGVYIYTNDRWRYCIPYIYTNNQWVPYNINYNNGEEWIQLNNNY